MQVNNKQLIYRGFTLIEVIIVIIVLAIIAVMAVPMISDLSPDAKQSAVQGVAGALNSASASNYGRRKANSTSGVAVANCTDVGPIMTGGLPGDYQIVAAAIGNNAKVTCTVRRTDDNSIQATFVGLGIS